MMVPVAVPLALGNRRVWRRAAQRDYDRLVTFGLVVSLHHDGDGFRRFVPREGQGARGDGGVVGAGGRRARAGIRVGDRRLHAGSPALGHLECQLARGASGPFGNTRPADRQCGWIIVVLDGDHRHRLADLDYHAPSRLRITQLDLDRLVQLVVGIVHHRYRDGLRSFACCEGQRLRNTRVVGAGGRRAPGDHFHRHLLVDRWIQGNRKDQRTHPHQRSPAPASIESRNASSSMMVPVAVPLPSAIVRVRRRTAQRDHDRLVTFGLVVSLHHRR